MEQVACSHVGATTSSSVSSGEAEQKYGGDSGRERKSDHLNVTD